MHSHENWNILNITFALYEPNFIRSQSFITDTDNFIEHFKLNRYRKMLDQLSETYLYMI